MINREILVHKPRGKEFFFFYIIIILLKNIFFYNNFILLLRYVSQTTDFRMQSFPFLSVSAGYLTSVEKFISQSTHDPDFHSRSIS